MTRSITVLAKMGLPLLILCSLVGYLGDRYYIFDLFSHFRLQYLWLAMALALVFSLSRCVKWLALAIIPLAVNGVEVIPWYFDAAKADERSEVIGQRSVRILFANVLTRNMQHSKILELITLENPDLIVLQETDKAWVEALSALDRAYQYNVEVPRSDNFGMAIYSRRPFSNLSIEEGLSVHGLPSIYLELDVNGQGVSIIATHPLPPMSPVSARARDHQMAQVGAFIKDKPGHKIIIGDLNATMWSMAYKGLIREAGLVNARRGFGVHASWPAGFPLLGIPIDHCLVSPEIQVVDFKTGPHIGSDHLPLIIDLAFKNTIN
ncbi:endonuclease/exonuclease/phosphatase family protein [bacterium]|nr:endonuclease/exonuclease/phosphatase family protein [bacterium]